MKKLSMITTALLSAGLALGAANPAFAASYTEVGDPGDLVSGAAQAVTGAAGETITSIKGALSLTAGISEGDAYKIYINSPSTFSASTTGFVPGSNSLDSQLFLFTLSGVGIVGNDDDGLSGGSQSAIPAGTSFVSSLTPGYYILLITGSGQNPTSSGGLIFPSWTAGADPTGVYGPTGPGGSLAISSFGGSSNEGGAYSIALTGVTTSAVSAVPEPSSVCLGLAGGLALLVMRRRRQNSDR